MAKDPSWLLEHRNSVYSQSGEDGILAKVLEVLPEKDKWCVEFGAWDGEYLSNTCNLIRNSDYSAVLIEGDTPRADALKQRFAQNNKIFPVNAFVGWQQHDSLDSILKKTPIPRNFDLLSIDIDGNDYPVWNAVVEYKPKVVIIEFNPTVPNGIVFAQEGNMNTSHGCSLDALVSLGKEKGYELVCSLLLNAVFVDKKYFHLFEISDNRPETLRKDLSLVTYIFSGYDGTIMLAGNKKLPWHNFPLEAAFMQQLPKALRKARERYIKPQKKFLYFYRKYILSKIRKLDA